jgi:acyl-CoA hydrolase
MDLSLLECTTLHLVKPQDLNHHGTLFAGQVASWLVEAGVITASRLVGKPEDIVCVKINGLTFKKPINNGDLLDLRSKIVNLGATSITVYSEVIRRQDNMNVVSNFITFVTVDQANKPYRHGFVLPEEFIAKNTAICAEAKKIREEKGRRDR